MRIHSRAATTRPYRRCVLPSRCLAIKVRQRPARVLSLCKKDGLGEKGSNSQNLAFAIGTDFGVVSDRCRETTDRTLQFSCTFVLFLI